MSITAPTFTPGSVLYAAELDTAYATLTAEINRLAALPHNSQNLAKNFVINGDFSQWNYATSHTTSGYGSADRWRSANTGTTKVFSQQSFALGQTDVTNNPKFYARTVVTTSAGAGNFCLTEQRIEDVTKLSGETVTLQFWAKAGSAKNVSVELIQSFGTGGSPSTAVDSIGVTTVALTTSWVLQTVTIAMPSVSGKTLGTAGDDYTAVRIWLDAGSNYDARTNSLGQQSGTFEIANVQLEISATATDFEYVTPADQLARCHRYFERISSAHLGGGYAETTTQGQVGQMYTHKRAVPTITYSSQTSVQLVKAGASETSTAISSALASTTSSRIIVDVASGLTAGEAVAIYILPGEYIDVSAEL